MYDVVTLQCVVHALHMYGADRELSRMEAYRQAGHADVHSVACKAVAQQLTSEDLQQLP